MTTAKYKVAAIASWFSVRKSAALAIAALLLALMPLPNASAFTNGQAATTVIGQADFTHGSANQGGGVSSTGLKFPFGAAFDSSGNLWVTDTSNNRVLRYSPPFSNGQAANLVIGQADFTTGGSATTATRLNTPRGLAFDSSGNLWVPDAFNNRVLRYSPPFSNGQAANLVIGQADFTSSGSATTATGLNDPVAIAFDSSGNLWVAEGVNNRVLRYSPPFSNGQAANLVIGQADFTHGSMNQGGGVSSTGLWFPFGAAFDSSGNLWVTDNSNNRVLRYSPPFSNGQAANLVIGQADFTTGGSATTATGLNGPIGIPFDSSGNLWVGDASNARVLRYSPPFSNGQAANLVIGQADFVSSGLATTATGLNGPIGIAFDSSGNLWVPDFGNNRVLAYQAPFDFTLSASGAITAVVGGSGSNTITATLAAGSTQLVALSCTAGLPTGASCGFSPVNGNPTFSSALTITTTGATPVGSTTVTVTGTGGGVTRTTTFTLTVNAPSFDFSLSATPGTQSVARGGSTTYAITVTLTSGSASPVTLSASGLPAGVSASFSPASGTPTFASTLTVSTSASAVPGTYPFTITATGGAPAVTKTTIVSLTIRGLCLIATAAYGSELSDQVIFLRTFRDDRVMSTMAGSEFMTSFNAWYYSFSPTIAAQVDSGGLNRAALQAFLYPAMGVLHAASANYEALSFNPELAAIFTGALAGGLLGLLYLALPVGLWMCARRRPSSSAVKPLAVGTAIAIAASTVAEVLGLTQLTQLTQLTSVGVVLAAMALASIWGGRVVWRFTMAARRQLRG